MKTLLKYSLNLQVPDFIEELYITENQQKREDVIYFSSTKIPETKSCTFVKSKVDCLNAEKNKCDIMIWQGENPTELEQLAPKNPPYGWMLLSINTPIYIHLKKISELDLYKNVDFQGVYTEDLILLDQLNKLT